MSGGSSGFPTAMLWVIGCAILVAIGGLSGILMANARADRTVRDTYFVVSHLHYSLILAGAFGFFGAWYYLFPKITGVTYSDLLAKIHFWMLFIGITIVLAPQILLSVGMVHRLAEAPYLFRYWNLVSSIGSYISAASTLVFFANMVLSSLYRRSTNRGGRHDIANE